MKTRQKGRESLSKHTLSLTHPRVAKRRPPSSTLKRMLLQGFLVHQKQERPFDISRINKPKEKRRVEYKVANNCSRRYYTPGYLESLRARKGMMIHRTLTRDPRLQRRLIYPKCRNRVGTSPSGNVLGKNAVALILPTTAISTSRSKSERLSVACKNTESFIFCSITYPKAELSSSSGTCLLLSSSSSWLLTISNRPPRIPRARSSFPQLNPIFSVHTSIYENAKFHGKLRRLFIGKANFREACSAFSQLPSFTPTKIGCDPGKLVARKSKMSDSGRASRQTEAVPAVIPSATEKNPINFTLLSMRKGKLLKSP
ncbi:hypothetical protein KQX54_004668 [Cotesia glomerata]|uniref:Ribosomal protein S4 n=1 Tax=Cotesia glomerata TaxID=32391 RepID=A0AAV7I9N9_COTGL|nr:hypothetical protein KQX54_004668 [Cotesia glomerata]